MARSDFFSWLWEGGCGFAFKGNECLSIILASRDEKAIEMIFEWIAENGSGWDMALALQVMPDWFLRFDTAKMDGWCILNVLRYQPRLFDLCDTAKMDKEEISSLLYFRPRLLSRCKKLPHYLTEEKRL